MGFTTKAFDLYYKRIGPTGSLNATWSYHNSAAVASTGPTFARVSNSFLNFPEDGRIGYGSGENAARTTTIWTTTRDSASNVNHLAIPWGSAAGDFLWNVLTPSWSFVNYSPDVVSAYPNPALPYYGQPAETYKINYISASFFGREWSKQVLTVYQKGSEYGIPTSSGYSVTSSWLAFDPKVFETGQNAVIDGLFNSQFIILQTVPADSSSYFGYDITWPAVNSKSTSSVDNQYFDQSGGAGITKTSISQSLITASAYATDNSATGLKYKTEALKARRLYFPVPYSGSGTTRGTDYWFVKSTGKRVDSIFYDNGGIYNVQFSLKRHIPNGYDPDLGSFMTAFIHNVIPQIPSSSNCIEGASGWYPPANNIVTIGNQYNGTSELSFYDIQTGFYVEKFNFNLIQYGYPAQLCLEVSGSLANNAYFGIIVDEFKMCKIGVTTDPRFIKPTSIATTVIDLGQQAFISAGSNPLFDGG